MIFDALSIRILIYSHYIILLNYNYFTHNLHSNIFFKLSYEYIYIYELA